ETDPAIIAFLANRDAPCPGCGYNLRGLTAPVCPECKRPVTLQLASDPMAKLRRPLVAALLLLAAMSLLFAIIGLYSVFRLRAAGMPYYSYTMIVLNVVYLGVGGFAAHTGVLALGLVRTRTPTTSVIARRFVYATIVWTSLTLLQWIGSFILF
ncbi:MAG: hypothetical protein ACOYN0_10205, partial [Phycisphaerales bacterium]